MTILYLYLYIETVTGIEIDNQQEPHLPTIPIDKLLSWITIPTSLVYISIYTSFVYLLYHKLPLAIDNTPLSALLPYLQ